MGCCASQSADYARQKKNKAQFSKGKVLLVTEESFESYYTTLSSIASGSFGYVQLVAHNTTGMKRAVKQIYVTDSSNQNQIMEEVEIMREMSHPNIVGVFEVYLKPKRVDIVMELCTGGELFDKIIQEKSFSENKAATYMLEIISAFNYMHSIGIMHRDIKPENLLLENQSENAKLKIADFGTSIHFEESSLYHLVIGTPYYMAPELVKGTYNHKCDVWSVGIIMYILLAGFPPFNGETEANIFHSIVNQRLNFPRKAWGNISEDAKDLVQILLNKNYENRPNFRQILDHPWLKRAKNTVPDNPIESLNKLGSFNFQCKLQNATLSYISSQLLTEEDTNELANVFKQIDTNKDGKISKKELQQAYSNHNLNFNAEELMNKCDQDENGFIDYNEFIMATVDWNKALSKQKLYEAFKIYDLDGNGTISIDEMKKQFGEENQHFFLQILKRADANQDGEIDFEEFSTYIMENLRSS